MPLPPRLLCVLLSLCSLPTIPLPRNAPSLTVAPTQRAKPRQQSNKEAPTTCRPEQQLAMPTALSPSLSRQLLPPPPLVLLVVLPLLLLVLLPLVLLLLLVLQQGQYW